MGEGLFSGDASSSSKSGRLYEGEKILLISNINKCRDSAVSVTYTLIIFVFNEKENKKEL